MIRVLLAEDEMLVRAIAEERVDPVLLYMSRDYVGDMAEGLVAWMLEDRLRARFQLQLQKYIWSPDAREV